MSKLRKHIVFAAVVLLWACLQYVGGACDYSSLSIDLNGCMATASGTVNTRWMFPYGTISQQATFCSSEVQTNLTTCISAIFSACTTDAKVLKMFSTSGSNLLNAYSALCADSLIIDAQACMSVIISLSTYTTAETSFAASVTALDSAASNTEICGLATTLKYNGYTKLLRVTCTTPSHLAVWATFYDTVLNTYLCSDTCSSASRDGAPGWLSLVLTILAYRVTRHLADVVSFRKC